MKKKRTKKSVISICLGCFLMCLLIIPCLASHNKTVEIIGPSELKLHEGKEFTVIEVRSTWYNPEDNSVYLKHGDSVYLLQNVPQLMYNEMAAGKTVIIR